MRITKRWKLRVPTKHSAYLDLVAVEVMPPVLDLAEWHIAQPTTEECKELHFKPPTSNQVKRLKLLVKM